jgi:hypothetical protein
MHIFTHLHIRIYKIHNLQIYPYCFVQVVYTISCLHILYPNLTSNYLTTWISQRRRYQLLLLTLSRLRLKTQVLSDEDIATNDTSTPTPVSTSTTPLGPITRAHAHRLTHQVSSLLSLGSSYLDNGDTCTLVLLRNNGLDQKGRGIVQAGFGLQDKHDLLHPDSILDIQALLGKLIKSTFQSIQNHLHICLE